MYGKPSGMRGQVVFFHKWVSDGVKMVYESVSQVAFDITVSVKAKGPQIWPPGSSIPSQASGLQVLRPLMNNDQ